MKVLFLTSFILASFAGSFAQGSSKDWTPWAPVDGAWAEFIVVVEFEGGPKSVEKLNKANLKSLKVECVIGGRIRGALPPEATGVKNVRLVFSKYGKVRGLDGFVVDFQESYYRKETTNFYTFGIPRPATAFDVEEGKKPAAEAGVDRKYAPALTSIIGALGMDHSSNFKLKGRIYSVGAEWRRKGSTIEFRVKDYQPS